VWHELPTGKLSYQAIVPGQQLRIFSGEPATNSAEAEHREAIIEIGPTLNFRQLRDQVGYTGHRRSRSALAPEAFRLRLLAMVGILLFVGAMGKSAQLPLSVWLPDAMAGPTPVSALIHAATMVTAGVYMVARLQFIFALSPTPWAGSR